MNDAATVTVRAAAVSDAGRLATLLTDEGYPAGASDLAARIERFSVVDSHVLVAEAGGEVIGFIAFHLMPRFETDERFARIVALVVDPGVRARGIGRRLMTEAEAVCKAEGGASWRSRRAIIGRMRGSCSSRSGTTRASPRTCASAPDLARRRPPASRVPILMFPRLRLRDEVAALLELPWSCRWTTGTRPAITSASCRSVRRGTWCGFSSRAASFTRSRSSPRASRTASSSSFATSRTPACRPSEP